MPQYIEFNKETSFPSSTAGTDNLGVDSTGNVALTDSSGNTVAVGSNSPLNYTSYIAKITETSPGHAEQIGGFLVVDATYQIQSYVGGDDFSNVADVQSGTINTTGCIFIATGAIPTIWINNSGLLRAPYPVPTVVENTFNFTPYWKGLDKGVYYFNFPYGIDYNKLTTKFSPTSTDNVLSTIAINPEHPFRDNTFYPNFANIGFNNVVYTTAIQSDGKIVCGGTFGGFDGTSTPYIARLNSDGTLDDTFSVGTGFNGPITSIATQSDGKIICGGDFNYYNEASIAYNIARLDSSGSLDTTFNTNAGTGFDTPVYTTTIQSDGKIICGGDSFSNFNGTAVNGIFRLNTDGTLDTTFNSGGSGLQDKDRVLSIAIQPDGKIICGGGFNLYNDVAIALNIMRLNTDGTLDTTFNTNAGTGFNNKYVASTAIQSDGKILCGGDFLDFDGNTANYIARLNANGTYDATFNSGTGFDNGVQTILLDTADNAFIGGEFTLYNGTTSNNIIRLDNSGSILNTFNNGFNTIVYTISQQSDGKIVVGGDFDTYDGSTNLYITRLFSSYDVVLTSYDYYGDGPANNLLLNNPVEIKLYN
jgi:uncharacterized delta-60 repeat protein